jgi:hypothetical protein
MLAGEPERIPGAFAGFVKGIEAGAEDILQTKRYGITPRGALSGGQAGALGMPRPIELRTDNLVARLLPSGQPALSAPTARPRTSLVPPPATPASRPTRGRWPPSKACTATPSPSE